jgi:hypothetical protein
MPLEVGVRLSSEDNASAARTSFLAVCISAPSLATFRGGFFLVEHVLWFYCHVDDVRGVVVEFGVCRCKCELAARYRTEYGIADAYL